MSFNPSPDQTQKDLIDMLTEGAQKIEEITNEDGTISRILMVDPETIYWKTQIVNSPHFSRFVYELKNLQALGKMAKNHMSEERALVLKSQIDEIVLAYRYSIDAKSSETLRNKQNTQSNLIDKLNSVKIEKSFTMKDKVEKSMWQSLIGGETKQEE